MGGRLAIGQSGDRTHQNAYCNGARFRFGRQAPSAARRPDAWQRQRVLQAGVVFIRHICGKEKHPKVLDVGCGVEFYRLWH